MLGEVWDGRYRVDALLGEGGIGKVYAAEHLSLGRQVALKVLLAKHEDTPLLRKRFEREAQALSELNHPHIVSITDVGVADGTPYLVMELLEGTTLAEYMRAQPVEPDTALSIARQILSAMAYAHARGIAHRDLKPQNIFVQTLADGALHVTVLDFGLVRFLDDDLRAGTKLTRKGALLGTPAYMAPEQAAGGEVDERADVYAAGLILYELLAGRRPFTSKDANELRRAHLVLPPPRMSEVDPGLEVHDALEELVDRALAKDAADRFADAEAMLAALDALPPGAARRVSPEARASVDESPTPDAVAATLAAGPAAVPVPAPGPKTWLRALFAAIGFVLFGGFVAGFFLHFSGDEDPTEAVAEPEPGTDDPREPETDAPTARARDPFADLPAELRPVLDTIEAGDELSRSKIGLLNRWSRAHPDDARSRLLLGRHFTSVRSLSWAFPQYQEAYGIDPGVRRWPPMLEDLLEMARSGVLADPASDLIVEAYGAEAVGAVEAQLEVRRRPVETRRLERLLVRVNAAP